jgi:hypothetical protein
VAGRELPRSQASRRDRLLSLARLLSEATWCLSTGGPELSRIWRQFGCPRTRLNSGPRRSGMARPLLPSGPRTCTDGSGQRPMATLHRTVTTGLPLNQTGRQPPKDNPGTNGTTGKTGDRRPRSIRIIRRRRYRGSGSRPTIRRGRGRPLPYPVHLTFRNGGQQGRPGPGARNLQPLMPVVITATGGFMPSRTARPPTLQVMTGARRPPSSASLAHLNPDPDGPRATTSRIGTRFGWPGRF